MILGQTNTTPQPDWLQATQKAIRDSLRPFTIKRGADYSATEQAQRRLALKLEDMIYGEFIERSDEAYRSVSPEYGYGNGYAVALTTAKADSQATPAARSLLPGWVELLLTTLLWKASIW